MDKLEGQEQALEFRQQQLDSPLELNEVFISPHIWRLPCEGRCKVMPAEDDISAVLAHSDIYADLGHALFFHLAGH